ncbi:DAK2 domain-containing protein [Sphaerisporangium perillae]|uniref:DAK2 domain-containing protein n=1 Tax=Sphaerisporangium perillae TaxID=2935860 RepID=UPI00200F7F03|nr:DAK2 domain-containing protein [Sphaerisporangium perillae]
MDAKFFTAWIEETARVIAANRDHLTRLDAAIGDADHGTNLDRGFAAVREALAARPAGTPGDVLTLTGTTLIRKVGGASGPLYGTAFRQMGTALNAAAQPAPPPADAPPPGNAGAVPPAGDAGTTTAPGAEGVTAPAGGGEVTLSELAAAFEAALAGVRRLGGAAEGDKTMVDALAPATRALAVAANGGMKPEEALDAALAAAEEGAQATIPLQARKGRASYLGERSIGHKDPGAASTALIFAALRAVAAG